MGVRIIIQGHQGEERDQAIEIVRAAIVKAGITCVRHQEQMDSKTIWTVFNEPKFATLEEVAA